jgi:hypothetical protein
LNSSVFTKLCLDVYANRPSKKGDMEQVGFEQASLYTMLIAPENKEPDD